MRNLPVNIFHNINQLPKQPGLLIFPISMSKIGNVQSAENCLKYIEKLAEKIRYAEVGLVFLYGDYLYFNSDEKASVLKQKFLQLIISHKLGFQNLIKNSWYVPKSFSFVTFNQVCLDTKIDFGNYLGKLRQIYNTDSIFRECVAYDANINGNRVVTENQITFFLEECLLFYFISKGMIKFQNDFVHGNEQWILNCYPGKPLKSEIYIFQKNFFELHNPINSYENAYYNLNEELLYEYDRINLETIQLS